MTLEDLLNTLIQRGWKPFGDIDIAEFNQIENTFVAINYDNKVIGQPKIRQIASKESGLWQYVCENGMYKKEALGIYLNYERAKNVFYKIDQFDEEGDVIQTGDMEGDRFIHMSEPEYRLIESALCDEDKLESFILDNIKIDE